jgi:hypothetical protein
MERKQQILRDQFILSTFQTPNQWEMKTVSEIAFQANLLYPQRQSGESSVPQRDVCDVVIDTFAAVHYGSLRITHDWSCELTRNFIECLEMQRQICYRDSQASFEPKQNMTHPHRMRTDNLLWHVFWKPRNNTCNHGK